MLREQDAIKAVRVFATSNTLRQIFEFVRTTSKAPASSAGVLACMIEDVFEEFPRLILLSEVGTNPDEKLPGRKWKAQEKCIRAISDGHAGLRSNWGTQSAKAFRYAGGISFWVQGEDGKRKLMSLALSGLPDARADEAFVTAAAIHMEAIDREIAEEIRLMSGNPYLNQPLAL